MKILLGNQSYEARSKGATGRRLVNLYSEPNPEGSKYPFSIYNTAGLVDFCDLGTSKAIQGMQRMGSLLYAVSGNEVFKITSAGVKTSLGSITGTEERVDMSNNGTQMSILNQDGDMWVATSSSVTSVSDSDFPSASSVTFLDGFTLVSTMNSGQFQKSGSYDSTAYDALDFATAEESPDNLVRVFAFNGALWLFGETSFEVYYNSGNALFPFEQMAGAVNTTRGLAAKFAVAQEDNGLFFLGDDRIMYRIVGIKPERISDHALEAAITDYTTISDAYCFVYDMDGHKMLVLTFPSENKSWEFDIATNLWHERTTLVGNLSKRWRANCHEAFAGKQLVGDNANGKIYYLSPSVYTESGEMIERVAQGSVVWDDNRPIIYDQVFLDIEAGVGLANGQGEDPQVMMRYSDDGAKSWSSEKWRSFGKIGEYKVRPTWRRLSQARQRLFEFKITDPVPVKINGCYAKGRIGAE